MSYCQNQNKFNVCNFTQSRWLPHYFNSETAKSIFMNFDLSQSEQYQNVNIIAMQCDCSIRQEKCVDIGLNQTSSATEQYLFNEPVLL